MRLSIPKDYFDGSPTPPRLFLCTPSGKIINELIATGVNLHAKWNSYSEISFETPMCYVDILTGETKIHPMYAKVESPRQIYAENIGFFILQDIDDTSGDNDIKSVTAFSSEYAVANKYLTSFYINTGEVGSREVTYNENNYGIEYSSDKDSFYKLASGTYDPYESYYVKKYTSTIDYVYEQTQIDAVAYAEYIDKNNDTLAQPHEKLYMKKFANVQFYHQTKPGLSLLHLALEVVPDWKIGHVDATLWHKERTFSQDRISVYDFLMNDVAETFGCVFEWNTITRTLNVYEEAEDGVEEDSTIQTRWATDVFISKDNLASEVAVKYSADNIKTKLTVSGGEDLNISEVNLDRNSIMNLSFYHSLDWMEPDLFEAYDKYLNTLKEAETGLDLYGLPSRKFPMSHSDAVKKWVAAQNKYHDLMHTVPAENNTVLVGDEFKKLYCAYTPPNTTENAITASRDALVKKLNLYHVDEDINGSKTDNVLLRLKNTSGDVATIRIYDPKQLYSGAYDSKLTYYHRNTSGSGVVSYTKLLSIVNETSFKNERNKSPLYTNNYTVQSVVARANSGISDAPSYWSMADWNINDNVVPKPFLDWIKGNLTADAMNLKGFTVSYIGTMGAYFVLTPNEFEIKNNELIPSKSYLRQYGVNLLKEKHDIYTTIFQTQTEAMFSNEGYQCTVSDNPPTGTIADGTRWLDTNSVPVELKSYNLTTNSWKTISASLSASEQANYENYQRYIDNYQKLQAVQEVLAEKRRESEYCLNGYVVSGKSIVLSQINDTVLKENMKTVALTHFKGHTVIEKDFYSNLPLYTFTTSYDPIKYGLNTGKYNPNEQYYIRNSTTFVYTPIVIESEAIFDAYNGESEDTKLYVVTSGHIYAVYLQGTTPYVAYLNSQGVYQMIRDYIRDLTEISKFFNEDQWIRLSPFIREDEFNDSNFFWIDGDSEEQKIQVMEELMEAANKELNTLCQPSLEFSMTMANILALPEFASLIDQFQLGNFIRVQIRDGYVKRARLLEVNLNFDDLSDFSCTFGNLVTTKSEIDKHAELLAQAVSAGKQVAVAAGTWQRSADKANKLEEAIADGLQDAALQIGRASGQAITWDANGFYCRKFVDGTTDQYENEQIAIINNKIVFTNDGWQTSSAALGEFQADINGDGVPETLYGLIAQMVLSGYIKGSVIEGGSLKIGGPGGQFIVNEDGSVQILGPTGESKFATNRFQIVLEHSRPTVFTDINDTCTVICKVYVNGQDKTSVVIANGGTFTWSRSLNTEDETWVPTFVDNQPNVIEIKNSDVDRNIQISCAVDFNETIFDITEEGGVS